MCQAQAKIAVFLSFANILVVNYLQRELSEMCSRGYMVLVLEAIWSVHSCFELKERTSCLIHMIKFIYSENTVHN